MGHQWRWRRESQQRGWVWGGRRFRLQLRGWRIRLVGLLCSSTWERLRFVIWITWISPWTLAAQSLLWVYKFGWWRHAVEVSSLTLVGNKWQKWKWKDTITYPCQQAVMQLLLLFSKFAEVWRNSSAIVLYVLFTLEHGEQTQGASHSEKKKNCLFFNVICDLEKWVGTREITASCSSLKAEQQTWNKNKRTWSILFIVVFTCVVIIQSSNLIG